MEIRGGADRPGRHRAAPVRNRRDHRLGRGRSHPQEKSLGGKVICGPRNGASSRPSECPPVQPPQNQVRWLRELEVAVENIRLRRCDYQGVEVGIGSTWQGRQIAPTD